jgi:hypothetical protein
VVKTSEDWTWPTVMLFIVYYVSHFYGGVNITKTMAATTSTYITLDSRKRASGNTCDVVYFLDRTLQNVQGLRLSNMQFYNTIYNVTQYNNTIAFSVTVSGTNTTPYSLTLATGNYVVSKFTAALQTLMNGASSGFTVSYTDITGLVTIANTNSFSVNFATSTMYVVLGFLPQQYAATTSITAPYALNLGMPAQVHIYISEVVNSYLGVQGGYDMPTYIVPVNTARGTIVNFKGESDYKQYVDIPNWIDINRLTVKLKSPSVAAGLPPDYISLNGSEYCMILEATRCYKAETNKIYAQVVFRVLGCD